MAHVEKFKSPALAPMLGHYARQKERVGYKRENIDGRRTPLNYTVGRFGTPDELAERVTHLVEMARVSHEMAAGRRVRADAVVMCDWVVTRPQDCPEELTGAFFESVLGFVQDRYGGPVNVPGGFVHLDEHAPHMHTPVVPVVDGKLQASKLVSRADLKTFHKALQARVDRDLDRHVTIELPEEQIGVKKLSQLAQPDYIAAQRAIAAANEERERAEQQAAVSRAEAARLKSEVEDKKAQVRGLDTEIEDKTARLESVRRIGVEFESGELESREKQFEQDVESLKPQVGSAKAEVAGLEERVRKLGERVERLRQQLVTRIKNAQRKLKPQVKSEKKPVPVVTRRAMPTKAPGRAK